MSVIYLCYSLNIKGAMMAWVSKCCCSHRVSSPYYSKFATMRYWSLMVLI